LEFDGRVLGAKIVTQMRYKDSALPLDPARCPLDVHIDDKTMHVSFRFCDTST